jgi:hypothetical protein
MQEILGLIASTEPAPEESEEALALAGERRCDLRFRHGR